MNRRQRRNARRGRQGVGTADTSKSVRRRRKRIRRVLLIWVGLLLLAGIVRACWIRQEQRPLATGKDRAHFCAVAATAMRQILSNHAQSKRTGKHNTKRVELTVDDLSGHKRNCPPVFTFHGRRHPC